MINTAALAFAEAPPSLAVAAEAALARGPAALVTVLATEGSAPRGAGARMLVTAADQVGTIGGGRLEWRAAEQARRILALPPGAWRVQDWPLGPLLGQCCGGRARLLIERLAGAEWLGSVEAGQRVWATLETAEISRCPGESCVTGPWRQEVSARGPAPRLGDRFVEPVDVERRPVLLFGAGHVGRAIARALAALPFQLGWYDSRPEADAPGVVVADEDALAACAGEAARDAAVLILTHDHGLDYRLTAAALGSPARFVGLIGSATKRARFVSRLRAEGVDPMRLTCPIGLAGIDGKEPEVIAVAVGAQLLSLRDPSRGAAT